MIFTTERLVVRELTIHDAPFIFKLLNTEGFKKNIGDRGIDTIEKAKLEIETRYTTSYPNFGFFVVEDAISGQAYGGVTLIDRDSLEYPDLGYAFLPEFSGQGFAFEASLGLVKWANKKGFSTLCAIVQSDNLPSISLLKKLGFTFSGTKKMENPEEVLDYYLLKAD